MKVLVLGASGSIGLPVCQAFLRAGHIVYGQTRSSATAAALRREEIIPIVCDPYTDKGQEEYGAIAKSIDVPGQHGGEGRECLQSVVDCLKGGTPSQAKSTFTYFRSLVAGRPKAGPKPTYIYTGGLWSITRGAGGLETWTDERQPRTDYLEAVQWRTEIEEPILLVEEVYGCVIRPSVVFGRAGSGLATYLFEPAAKAGKGGVFETLGREDTRFQTIHADDLAELYVRVGERGMVCKGQTFVGANPLSESLVDICTNLVRVSGCAGFKFKEPKARGYHTSCRTYDYAWCSTLNIHPSLGQALTGWTARRMGLVDSLEQQWMAYLAWQNTDSR